MESGDTQAEGLPGTRVTEERASLVVVDVEEPRKIWLPRVRPVRGQEQQSTVSIFSTVTSTTNAIKSPNPSPSIHPGYKNGSRAPALTDSSSDARPGTLVRGRCGLGAGRKLRTGPVCNPEWRGGSPPACRASQLMHRSVPWRRVSIWRHAELGGA